MIKFFRHIRKSLIEQNQMGKYFKYAIGEIALVMIGILLALQVNNWNQERLLKNEEQLILKNINIEFIENKTVLETSLKENNIGFNAAKTLMSFVAKDRTYINKHNVDSLFYLTLETASFRPSDNTISDLLQSGRLQLLQNENLKNLIYKWTRAIKTSDVRFERVELKIDNELVPYLSKHYSMKDIDIYGSLAWKQKTNLTIDKLKVFEDIEFENILDDYLYRVNSSQNGLKNLATIIDDIIKETNHD